MAGPMVLGIAAIILFQVVDTFFIGRLGPRPLAAMGFTFPVTFLVLSAAMGIGTGTTAVVARAIGGHDHARVQRLTTDSLLLATGLVIVVAMIGLALHNPIFRAMGAGDALLPLIASYMVPWFLGVALLVVPMVGNSAIRATGDTRSPAVIMIVAGLVNAGLDPVLIFGLGPFPRLELAGAAIASVISWAVTLAASAYLLTRRENLIAFRAPRLAEVRESWRSVLHLGAPSAATQALVPLSGAIITRIVAGFGEQAVAAFGVGIRLESLALIGVSALSAAMTPFVAQNLGANNCDRLRAASRFAIAAALAWGAGVAALLALFAYPLARIFNADAGVIGDTVAFLRILPVTYGLYGVATLMSAVLVASSQPLRAAFINLLRLFAFAVPLAWAGALVLGLDGVFGGMAAANTLIGLVAIAMVMRFIGAKERELAGERVSA